MRLTIVIADKSVGKDGEFYSDLDLPQCGIPTGIHALQWAGDVGFIEFEGHCKPEEPITQLPDWALSCLALWQAAYDKAHLPEPAPTPDQITLQNKAKAESLLYDSDFAVLPDVGLINKTDWEAYRVALRAIAINPTVDPVWPTRPPTVWA
jgi:hypothetical protein